MTFDLIFFKHLFIVHVCVHRRTKNHLEKLFLSFYSVGPGDLTLVVRLGVFFKDWVLQLFQTALKLSVLLPKPAQCVPLPPTVLKSLLPIDFESFAHVWLYECIESA